MFLIFVLTGVMCDFLSHNTHEGKVIITAYCLLTVCALAVVISAGMGFAVPGPGTFLEATLTLFKGD